MRPSWIQCLFTVLLTCSVGLKMSYAQKKIDPIIPDAEKRKVIRAQKLYNEFRIAKGEEILKDLCRTHSLIPYYHEALVQMQRQVLRQIPEAAEQLKQYQTPMPGTDKANLISDSLDVDQDSVSTTQKPKQQEVEWDGFDTGVRKVDIKKKEVKDVDAEVEITEAVVTIDSTLLKEEPLSQADENGLEVNIPTKDNSLKKELKGISELNEIPYQHYLDDFIQNCRRATLQVAYADSASRYLRAFLVDTLSPDLGVSDEAMAMYQNALEAWADGAENVAITTLQNALLMAPNYYSANMLLGDMAYNRGMDSLAFVNYIAAALVQKNRPEPYERMYKLHYRKGKYEDAAAAMIQGISRYPQQNYFTALGTLVQKGGKVFQSQWIRREVYPLSFRANYFEISVDDRSPWWFYQMADQDVRMYVDSAGLLQPNIHTRERYLEVYAWDKMLDSTAKDTFRFARAMREAGFLDCYTLITCFHQDLYEQYHDLTVREPQKVKDYFYLLINWDDRKFDKIRKKYFPETKSKK